MLCLIGIFSFHDIKHHGIRQSSRNVWTDSLRIAEPGARAETRGADGNRRKTGIGGGSGEQGRSPEDGFCQAGCHCAWGGPATQRPASDQVISLRPMMTGPRCSQKAANQLAGGWVDILRESSSFFLTELSQASIHGGFPRHFPAPQLPEVMGHTSPAASTDVLAQCFQK